MKRCYEYQDSKPLAKVELDFESANILIKQFSSTYRMIRYLLSHFFGITHCSINFAGIEPLTFQIQCDHYGLILNLDGEDFTFTSPEFSYHFTTKDSLTASEAQLIEFAVYQNERFIIERFASHSLELEIHFKNNSKVCFFHIPIDMSYTFLPECCNFLKEDADLLRLRQFYMTFFYPKQGEYNQKHCLTTLSIWSSSKEGNLEKETKLDELVLKDGQRVGYQLTEQQGNVRVILKDDEFHVLGYVFSKEENSCRNGDVDLNGIFGNLVKLQRTLI